MHKAKVISESENGGAFGGLRSAPIENAARKFIKPGRGGTRLAWEAGMTKSSLNPDQRRTVEIIEGRLGRAGRAASSAWQSR